MSRYADQMMVSCVALRLVKDLITDGVEFDNNAVFNSICADIAKDCPCDNIYHDQTIAVACFMLEQFDDDGYPDSGYLQTITDIIAHTHNSAFKKKGLISRIFSKEPTQWDASMRVIAGLKEINETMAMYPYEEYIRDLIKQS